MVSLLCSSGGVVVLIVLLLLLSEGMHFFRFEPAVRSHLCVCGFFYIISPVCRVDLSRSAGTMSMLPASMDEDLEGGAKEAMKKMEGKQVRRRHERSRLIWGCP